MSDDVTDEIETEEPEAPAKPKKKAAPKKSKAREPKPPVRMKIVWTVGEPGGVALKTFPYAERAAADAAAKAHAKFCIVKPTKVPFEDA
jgi:hypothetical protein